MKKIFTLTLFYFFMCMPAFAIFDASLPGAAPDAINKQNETLRELEKIDKVIENAEKAPKEEEIKADTKQYEKDVFKKKFFVIEW